MNTSTPQTQESPAAQKKSSPLDSRIDFEHLRTQAATKQELTKIEDLIGSFEREGLTTYRAAILFARQRIRQNLLHHSSGIRDPYGFEGVGRMGLVVWYLHLEEKHFPKIFPEGYRAKELQKPGKNT